MSLCREPCTVQEPAPRVIQTYSKKSKSSSKSRSKDNSSIRTALSPDVLDEINATASDHKDLSAAGVPPKESVLKPIRLSLNPKEVHSLTKEPIGDKARSIKDGQTRRKPRRHRRASVHEISRVKSVEKPSSDIETDTSTEDTLGPRDDHVSPVKYLLSTKSHTPPSSRRTSARTTLSRIRRNIKLPVHDTIEGFRFPSLPFNSRKTAFADWRPDSALTGHNEPWKKICVEPLRKKTKHADRKGSGFSGLVAMPRPVGSVETFSTPRDQELLIHPEINTLSRHENKQVPILSEDFQYTTGSRRGPTSKLSQTVDNGVLTEQIKRLSVSSQLSKDHHNSQAFSQIKQVSSTQQQLLRSKKTRYLTKIDGDPPSITQYDERRDRDRHNKDSLFNDGFPNLQTNSISLNEGVSFGDRGDTSKQLEEASRLVNIQDSTLKPLDCGLPLPIPLFFDPLGQLEHPAETRARTCQAKVNESARLRASISIKALSRDPEQASDQAWHVTLTNSKGIRVDVQEEILDDTSPGLLKQPRCRLPDLNGPHAEVGRTPDTRCGCCAETGSSTKSGRSIVPFDKPGVVDSSLQTAFRKRVSIQNPKFSFSISN